MESMSNGSVPGIASKVEGSTASTSSVAGLESLRAIGSSALASAISSVGGGGSASAPQIDSLRQQASAVWSSARSWNEFCNTKKFTPAANLDEVRQRIMENGPYFAANYVIIFVAFSALGILVHPMSFVCVLIVLGLYFWMFMATSGPVRMGPINLSVQGKRIAFGVSTVFFLWLTNAFVILSSWFFFSLGVAVVHAGGRISVNEADFDSLPSEV